VQQQEVIKKFTISRDKAFFNLKSVAWACADDVGTALSALEHLLVFVKPFWIAEHASGLQLKPSKCIIVPLVPL